MKNKTLLISTSIVVTALLLLIILFYILFVENLNKFSYLNISMLILGVLLNGTVVLGFLKITNSDDSQLPFLFQFSGITTVYGGIIIALTLLSNIIPFFKVITFTHILFFLIWLITAVYLYLSLRNSQNIEKSDIVRQDSLKLVFEAFENAQYIMNADSDENNESISQRFNLLASNIKNLAAVKNPEAMVFDKKIVNSINQFLNVKDANSLAELEFLISKRKKIRSI